MKLFTKIFLQVICVVLLLSSGIFFYTTYRWKNQSIQKLIQERIAVLQANFARFEQIKRFTLLPRAFSKENGEITDTLKIRRAAIYRIFQAEIEAMYA